MKFYVSRASSFSGKPCEEAVLGEETRTIHTVFGDKTFRTEIFFIEIESLDELMRFFEKYGDIVIFRKKEYEQYNTITIYDDYLE